MEDTKTELFAILRTIKEQERAVQEAIARLEKAAADTERQVTYGVIQRVERDCVDPIKSAVMEFRYLSFAHMALLFFIGLGLGVFAGAEYMGRRAYQPCQATTDRLDQWIDELRKADAGPQKRKK
jgi:hypothetical protein